MRFFTTASFFALATLLYVSAAPVRRQVDPNNLLVLQFADVLENLETQFYTQGLKKFGESDFAAAGFTSAQIPVEQLTVIMQDEATHVTVLESVILSLGAQPLSGCQFDFSSVLTDIPTMAAAARLVENVGVGAYLGAAHLVSDATILTAAASIVTVEARHQTILNILNNGQAIPLAFDLPLLPGEVLAIAGSFISGCDVGIKANPALAITNTGAVTAGTSLQFKSSAINGSTDGMFCQMLQGGMPFSIQMPMNSCVVPAGIQGPVAIFITSDDQPLNNNARDRGSNALVAGPAMAFIDKAEALGSLVHMGQGASNGSSQVSSTQTISPADASSIISNASGAAPTDSASAASATDSASAASVTDSASAASVTDSASAASVTDSAAASSASGDASASATASGSATPANGAQSVPTPGGPNLYSGPSPDGKTWVNGVSMVPAASITAVASTASASGSAPASDSAAAPSSAAASSAASSPSASA